jgi:tRNA(Ile)-lysidine synthetase-like protein
VYREYDELKKARRAELEPVCGKWPLIIGGETRINALGVSLICHPDPAAAGEGSRSLRQEVLCPAQNGKKTRECFDLDSLGDSPFIRTWQEGDRFQPLGMDKEKKLQDFFVDEKVPRRQRGRILLLCAADGRIAWVVGVRIADPFKIGKTTRRVLRMRVEPLREAPRQNQAGRGGKPDCAQSIRKRNGGGSLSSGGLDGFDGG